MTNWLSVALAAGAVYQVFIVFAAKRQWTWAALGVAVANFFYVLLNLAAPFRGILDPEYAGYNVGALHIDPGLAVTMVAGGIVALSLAAACVALLNRPGRGMAFVAGVDCLLLLAIGLPVLIDALAAPTQFRIELGEYLQIPGLVAATLAGAMFCLPLIGSIAWSSRRIRPV
jgi:hypothetical protein